MNVDDCKLLIKLVDVAEEYAHKHFGGNKPEVKDVFYNDKHITINFK